MERYEVAIEVGPIEPGTVERLKLAGHAVYQGNHTWRVIANHRVEGPGTVTEQARSFANDILIDFNLDPLHAPATIVMRNPDDDLELAVTELLFEDVRRSNDPDPLRVTPHKWWHKDPEVGSIDPTGA